MSDRPEPRSGVTDLEKVLRVIDKDECVHRPHYVVPWVARAADRIVELELALHAIVGHGNITVERAKAIAAEALGKRK